MKHFLDLMQLHFIEMPKFSQQERENSVDMNVRLAKWLRFLNKAIFVNYYIKIQRPILT